MRLYTLCNYYLSSIQQGIQTAHVVSELFVKYAGTVEHDTLFEWAKNHKTIIVLNGGNSKNVYDAYQDLKDLAVANTTFPIVYFKEDRQSLNEAVTCAGIVIPENVYVYAESVRHIPADDFTARKLIQTQHSLNFPQAAIGHYLNQFSLAK